LSDGVSAMEILSLHPCLDRAASIAEAA